MLRAGQKQLWRQVGQLRVNCISLRLLHATQSLAVVKPFLLADIGEGMSLTCNLRRCLAYSLLGIKEVQIIQWLVVTLLTRTIVSKY